MAVMLSDESMGILLLSSFHCYILVERMDEDAALKRAKFGKQSARRRRQDKS